MDGDGKNNYLPLFYFNVFFACVSFSIIMPSLAPYLERCGAGSTNVSQGWGGDWKGWRWKGWRWQ